MKSCIKKFIKPIPVVYWVCLILIVILTLSSGVSYIKLYFNENTYDSYFLYKDTSVEIKDGRINGKLNRYIDIKHRNSWCYIKNCGFPEEGVYQLSSIQIYELDGSPFVFKSCLDENNVCFYNISSDFIYSLKEKKLEKLAEEVRIGFISLVIFLLFELIEVILYYKYKMVG